MPSRSSESYASRPSPSLSPRLATNKSLSASVHPHGPNSSHTCRATKSLTSTSRSHAVWVIITVNPYRYRTSPSRMRMQTRWRKLSLCRPIVGQTVSWTMKRRRIRIHGRRRRQRYTQGNEIGFFKSSTETYSMPFDTPNTLFADD